MSFDRYTISIVLAQVQLSWALFVVGVRVGRAHCVVIFFHSLLSRRAILVRLLRTHERLTFRPHDTGTTNDIWHHIGSTLRCTAEPHRDMRE